MRRNPTAKIWLLIGGFVFLSGALSLFASGQRGLSASQPSEDSLNLVGVDLAQGSRAKLLSTRMQAQATGDTTYTIELETNAKP